MANLAASGVSYSLVGKQIKESTGKKRNLVKISFGDGSSTYPANGIPLNGGKMGCPNNIDRLVIMGPPGASDTNSYEYDQTNNTIRIYKEDTVTAKTYAELASGTAVVPTVTLFAEVVGW